MQTDHLDVVQFHSSPSQRTLQDNGAVDALLKLKDAGKVRMRVLGGAKLLILGDGALGPRAAPRTLDVVEDGYVRASRRLGVTGTTSTTVELHLRLASSQAQ
jgi:hypothetical protein